MSRYLTKITDQIICLISPDEAASLVWHEGTNDDNGLGYNDDSDDRVFTFEVATTSEQEEDVTMRPGFRVGLQLHSRA
jgi:hypothetical protein